MSENSDNEPWTTPPTIPSPPFIISRNDTQTSYTDSDGSNLSDILRAPIGEQSFIETQRALGRELQDAAPRPRTQQRQPQQQHPRTSSILANNQTTNETLSDSDDDSNFDLAQLGPEEMHQVHKLAAKKYNYTNRPQSRAHPSTQPQQRQEIPTDSTVCTTTDDDDDIDPDNYQPGDDSVRDVHKIVGEKHKNHPRPRPPRIPQNVPPQENRVTDNPQGNLSTQVRGEQVSNIINSSISSDATSSISTTHHVETTASLSQETSHGNDNNDTLQKPQRPLISTPKRQVSSCGINQTWELTPITGNSRGPGMRINLNTLIEEESRRQSSSSSTFRRDQSQNLLLYPQNGNRNMSASTGIVYADSEIDVVDEIEVGNSPQKPRAVSQQLEAQAMVDASQNKEPSSFNVQVYRQGLDQDPASPVEAIVVSPNYDEVRDEESLIISAGLGQDYEEDENDNDNASLLPPANWVVEVLSQANELWAQSEQEASTTNNNDVVNNNNSDNNHMNNNNHVSSVPQSQFSDHSSSNLPSSSSVYKDKRDKKINSGRSIGLGSTTANGLLVPYSQSEGESSQGNILSQQSLSQHQSQLSQNQSYFHNNSNIQAASLRQQQEHSTHVESRNSSSQERKKLAHKTTPMPKMFNSSTSRSRSKITSQEQQSSATGSLSPDITANPPSTSIPPSLNTSRVPSRINLPSASTSSLGEYESLSSATVTPRPIPVPDPFEIPLVSASDSTNGSKNVSFEPLDKNNTSVYDNSSDGFLEISDIVAGGNEQVEEEVQEEGEAQNQSLNITTQKEQEKEQEQQVVPPPPSELEQSSLCTWDSEESESESPHPGVQVVQKDESQQSVENEKSTSTAHQQQQDHSPPPPHSIPSNGDKTPSLPRTSKAALRVAKTPVEATPRTSKADLRMAKTPVEATPRTSKAALRMAKTPVEATPRTSKAALRVAKTPVEATPRTSKAALRVAKTPEEATPRTRIRSMSGRYDRGSVSVISASDSQSDQRESGRSTMIPSSSGEENILMKESTRRTESTASTSENEARRIEGLHSLISATTTDSMSEKSKRASVSSGNNDDNNVTISMIPSSSPETGTVKDTTKEPSTAIRTSTKESLSQPESAQSASNTVRSGSQIERSSSRSSSSSAAETESETENEPSGSARTSASYFINSNNNNNNKDRTRQRKTRYSPEETADESETPVSPLGNLIDAEEDLEADDEDDEERGAESRSYSQNRRMSKIRDRSQQFQIPRPLDSNCTKEILCSTMEQRKVRAVSEETSIIISNVNDDGEESPSNDNVNEGEESVSNNGDGIREPIPRGKVQQQQQQRPQDKNGLFSYIETPAHSDLDSCSEYSTRNNKSKDLVDNHLHSADDTINLLSASEGAETPSTSGSFRTTREIPAADAVKNRRESQSGRSLRQSSSTITIASPSTTIPIPHEPTTNASKESTSTATSIGVSNIIYDNQSTSRASSFHPPRMASPFVGDYNEKSYRFLKVRKTTRSFPKSLNPVRDREINAIQDYDDDDQERGQEMEEENETRGQSQSASQREDFAASGDAESLANSDVSIKIENDVSSHGEENEEEREEEREQSPVGNRAESPIEDGELLSRVSSNETRSSIFATVEESLQNSSSQRSQSQINTTTTLSRVYNQRFLKAAILKSMRSNLPEVQNIDIMFHANCPFAKVTKVGSNHMEPIISLKRIPQPRLNSVENRNSNRNAPSPPSSVLSTASTAEVNLRSKSKRQPMFSTSSLHPHVSQSQSNCSTGQSQSENSSQSQSHSQELRRSYIRKPSPKKNNSMITPSEIYAPIQKLFPSQLSNRSSVSSSQGSSQQSIQMAESIIPEHEFENNQDFEGEDEICVSSGDRMVEDEENAGIGHVPSPPRHHNSSRSSKRDHAMVIKQELVDNMNMDIDQHETEEERMEIQSDHVELVAEEEEYRGHKSPSKSPPTKVSNKKKSETQTRIDEGVVTLTPSPLRSSSSCSHNNANRSSVSREKSKESSSIECITLDSLLSPTFTPSKSIQRKNLSRTSAKRKGTRSTSSGEEKEVQQQGKTLQSPRIRTPLAKKQKTISPQSKNKANDKSRRSKRMSLSQSPRSMRRGRSAIESEDDENEVEDQQQQQHQNASETQKSSKSNEKRKSPSAFFTISKRKRTVERKENEDDVQVGETNVDFNISPSPLHFETEDPIVETPPRRHKGRKPSRLEEPSTSTSGISDPVPSSSSTSASRRVETRSSSIKRMSVQRDTASEESKSENDSGDSDEEKRPTTRGRGKATASKNRGGKSAAPAGRGRGRAAKSAQSQESLKAAKRKRAETAAKRSEKYFSNEDMLSQSTLVEILNMHQLKMSKQEINDFLNHCNTQLAYMCDALMKQSGRPNGMFTFRQLEDALRQMKVLDNSLGKNTLLIRAANLLTKSQFKAAQDAKIFPLNNERDTLYY